MQTLILGIESSCDETAAAVVADGTQILSSVVASQLNVHARYGGVVPELASREHLRAITPVVREALLQAGVTYDQLSAIAATSGPGLIGSLLVGVTYAKALCFARGLPLISVNHVEGHIHSVVMQHPEISFPAVALVVSGGHTHIFKVSSPGVYKLLGKTRDDAAGEAFDKVGKLLGLPFPGGPVIDQLAPYGNQRAVKFSFVRMKGSELDFSFSGIKTAVLRWTEANQIQAEIEARRQLAKPSLQDLLTHTPRATLDLLASFQYTVIEELLRRAVMAAELIHSRDVIFAGGVACNAGLRKAATGRAGLQYFFPPMDLATDNAAMIAAAAMLKFKLEDFAGFDLRPKANMPLAV